MPKRTEVDRRARASRRKVKSAASASEAAHPPRWIEPQLTRLVEEAPQGADWLHEIKYDGYRMHARIDSGKIQLLTRTGLDWSHRYKRTIEALRSLKVKSAYLDGELCALNADGLLAGDLRCLAESSRGDRTAISECRFRCRQDLDSTHSLCGLVQGAEHLARSSGAPHFRERGRATSTYPALKMHLRAVVMR